MKLEVKNIIIISSLLIVANTLFAIKDQQCPYVPVQNLGWDLYTTLINQDVPFFTSPTDSRVPINTASKPEAALNPLSAHNKNALPTGQQFLTKGISLIYANNTQCFQPQGQALFGANNLASIFNSMVEAIRSTGRLGPASSNSSKFVSIFLKLQYQILNDLYIYLTGLYTNFILTIASIKETDKFKIYGSYSELDITHDLTNKSLIVCHLLNLIQGQMYNLCSSKLPLIPTSLTIRTGSVLLDNDQSIDPLFLLLDLRRPFFKGDDPNSELHKLLINIQNNYMRTLEKALNFFKEYTNYIEKAPNTFMGFAATIKDVLNRDLFNQESKRLKKQYANDPVKKHAELSNVRKRNNPINPPLLYFDTEMIRALQILPSLAKAVNPNSQLVDWPEQIKNLELRKEDATDGAGNPLPFKAATMHDDKLYLQFASPRGVPYMQELIKQPQWLNSPEGVFKIIRACLGDFGQLIGLNIVDPACEFIIAAALRQPQKISKDVSDKKDRKLQVIYSAQDNYEKNCDLKALCCNAAQTDKSYKDRCDYLTKTCS